MVIMDDLKSISFSWNMVNYESILYATWGDWITKNTEFKNVFPLFKSQEGLHAVMVTACTLSWVQQTFVDRMSKWMGLGTSQEWPVARVHMAYHSGWWSVCLGHPPSQITTDWAVCAAEPRFSLSWRPGQVRGPQGPLSVACRWLPSCRLSAQLPLRTSSPAVTSSSSRTPVTGDSPHGN